MKFTGKNIEFNMYVNTPLDGSLLLSLNKYNVSYRLGGLYGNIFAQGLKNDIFETGARYISILTDQNGK